MQTPDTEPRRNVGRARVVSVRAGGANRRVDELAAEEPMEIRAGGPRQEPVSIAVTMRTPGSDFELAVGFLFTEGLVAQGEVERVSYCDNLNGAGNSRGPDYNVVTVRLNRDVDPSALRRSFFATSSCGICGKASLDEVEVRCDRLGPGPVVARSVVTRLPDALRERQRVFSRTGGLHGAGLFDAGGRLGLVREDVGRHNALDKLIGAQVLERALPLSESVAMVSCRVGFEIVQKAAVAGIPILCAVSAPSTLAVAAAERLGVTVVGFLRGDTFNVYTHPDRIDLDA